MRTQALIALYLAAAVIANLVVTWLGPVSAPAVGFGLIGCDLVVRDALHERWQGRGLALRLGGLIAAGSLLSYLACPASRRIATASMCAFAVAATVDTIVYALLHGRRKLVKSNVSNLFSSAADSLVFPTVAFGAFMPSIVALQFVAKVGGGALWSVVLFWRRDGQA